MKYLEYFLLTTKIYFSFINFDVSIFWVSKSSSRDVISHRTIYHTSNIKKSEFKPKKCWIFPNSLLIFIYFFRQYLTQILRPTPLPQLLMLFSSIWDSVVEQASVLLLFHYAETLNSSEGPDLFLQNGPFQNSHKCFQELTFLNNLFNLYWVTM